MRGVEQFREHERHFALKDFAIVATGLEDENGHIFVFG